MRHVSKKLAASANTPSTLSTALLLMHVGTAPRTVGKQRGALMAKTLELVNEKVLPWVEKGDESNVHNAFADFISEYACYYYPPDEKDRAADPDTKIGSTRIDFSISNTLHESALSLVSSLGGIGASFDPEINDPVDVDMKPYVFAQKLCTECLASKFAAALTKSMEEAEKLIDTDIVLI